METEPFPVVGEKDIKRNERGVPMSVHTAYIFDEEVMGYRGAAERLAENETLLSSFCAWIQSLGYDLAVTTIADDTLYHVHQRVEKDGKEEAVCILYDGKWPIHGHRDDEKGPVLGKVSKATWIAIPFGSGFAVYDKEAVKVDMEEFLKTESAVPVNNHATSRLVTLANYSPNVTRIL